MSRFLIIVLFLSTLAFGLCSAQEQQVGTGKHPVLVVLIFDESCKAWCQKVRPVMQELKKQYKDKLEIVELDASEQSLMQAKATAKSHGVYAFLSDAADFVPVVGVFSSRKKLLKELVGPKPKEVYTAAIDKALSYH